MTLVITLFAAIASTAWWYAHAPQSKMRVDLLCWMYWGASLMWMFVVALAGIVWIGYLIVKDPRGVRTQMARRETGLDRDASAGAKDLVASH